MSLWRRHTHIQRLFWWLTLFYCFWNMSNSKINPLYRYCWMYYNSFLWKPRIIFFSNIVTKVYHEPSYTSRSILEATKMYHSYFIYLTPKTLKICSFWFLLHTNHHIRYLAQLYNDASETNLVISFWFLISIL